MAFLSIAPTGTVLPFAGSVAPEGWAICNGAALNRTTYQKLFAVISTNYGIGDGINTFNLPDMQGVFPRGAGTNNTSNYGGVSGHTPNGGTVAAKGGQKTAKNSLSIGASTAAAQQVTNPGALIGYAAGQSLSGSNNIALASGAAANGGVEHSHGMTVNRMTAGTDQTNNNEVGVTGTGVYGPQTWSTGNSSAYLHTHTVSGTTSINHSHSDSSIYFASYNIGLGSSSVTVGAITGNDETTPASLSLNYIIKL